MLFLLLYYFFLAIAAKSRFVGLFDFSGKDIINVDNTEYGSINLQMNEKNVIFLLVLYLDIRVFVGYSFHVVSLY